MKNENEAKQEISDYLSNNQSIKLGIPREMLRNLRLILNQRGNISIQRLFKEVATRIILCDENMLKLLDEIQKTSVSKSNVRVLSGDYETLYSLIEQESPIMKGGEIGSDKDDH